MKTRAVLMGSSVVMLIMLLVSPVWAQAIPQPMSRANTPAVDIPAAVRSTSQLTVTQPLPLTPKADAPASANGVYRKGYHRLTENDVEDDKPVTAFNSASNEYLVVWSECPTTDLCNVVGRRTTSQGVPIGNPFAISSGHKDILPAIGYNSYFGEYLVTYARSSATDSDLYGRIILSDGTLYGSELTIDAAPGYQTLANIAFNPTAINNGNPGEYLVVYEDAGDIVARHIGSYGNVDASSHPIDIVGKFTTPDVAYNPARNEYLVTYAQIISDTPPIHNSDVLAWRVNAAGTLLGSKITIATGTADATRPQVAVGADTYFIAFSFGQNDLIGAANIVGSWVTGDGAEVIPFPTIIAESPPVGLGVPRVAYTGYGFLVTWQSLAGQNTGDVYGRYVRTQPGFWSGVFEIDTTPDSDQTIGDVACTTGSCLFVDRDEWQGGTDGEIVAWNLWLQQIYLPLTLK